MTFARKQWVASAAVEGCVLVVLQAVLIWGFAGWSDLNVQDDAQYMRQGLLLFEGRFSEVDYAWSLPLASLFALLHGLGVPVRFQPDVISVGCACASTLAVWWALRKLIAPTAACLAAAWWAGSAQALHLQAANSYALGLALGCLAIGLVARGRYSWALGVLVLASLNRGEVSVWLACGGVFWLIGRRSGRLNLPRVTAWAFAGCGGLLFVLLNYGWKARNRSWFAFRRHFQWGHPQGATTADAFPGAASLPQALQADPSAFLEHIARNLLELPQQLLRLVFDAWGWAPPVHMAALTSLLLLALLGALRCLRPQQRALPTTTRSDAQRAAVLLLAAAPAVLLVSVLLLPRPPLLLPVLPLALFALFGLATVGLRSLALPRQPPAPLLLALPLCAAVATTGSLHAPTQLENRAAIQLIREHVPPHADLHAPQAHELVMYAQVEGVQAWDLNSTPLSESSAQATAPAQHARQYLLDMRPRRAPPSAPRQLDPLLTGPDWQLVARRGTVALFVSTAR